MSPRPHLEAALEATSDPRVRYHIRQALQLTIAFEDEGQDSTTSAR